MNDNSIELIRGSFAEFQEDQNIKGAFKTGKVKKCKDIFFVLSYAEEECGDKNTEQHRN